MPKDRFYKEMVKRTLPKSEYWESPPRGWKGTRLQWSVTKKFENKIKEMAKSGMKSVDIRKFRKEHDFDRDINSLPIPLNSKALS